MVVGPVRERSGCCLAALVSLACRRWRQENRGPPQNLLCVHMGTLGAQGWVVSFSLLGAFRKMRSIGPMGEQRPWSCGPHGAHSSTFFVLQTAVIREGDQVERVGVLLCLSPLV